MLSSHRALITVIATTLLAACERETAPLRSQVGGVPAAHAAIGSALQQSFELTVVSSGDGITARSRVFHVSRQRTSRGWKTTVAMDPTPMPNGQGVPSQ